MGSESDHPLSGRQTDRYAEGAAHGAHEVSLGNGIGRGSDVHPTHGFIGDGADDQATHIVLMNPADALPPMPHATTKAKAREAFQRRKSTTISADYKACARDHLPNAGGYGIRISLFPCLANRWREAEAKG